MRARLGELQLFFDADARYAGWSGRGLNRSVLASLAGFNRSSTARTVNDFELAVHALGIRPSPIHQIVCSIRDVCPAGLCPLSPCSSPEEV